MNPFQAFNLLHQRGYVSRCGKHIDTQCQGGNAIDRNRLMDRQDVRFTAGNVIEHTG